MKRALIPLVFLLPAAGAGAAIDVGGDSVRVVDMHLHPGNWGVMPTAGKQWILSAVPPQFLLHAPAMFNTLQDPWADHLGIRAQADWAGVDRAVLYATYAQHTAGHFTNRELQATLADPANDDGWAVGLASINLDDIEDPDVRARRTTALASYFAATDSRIVGIKLAHAHQGVALDDEVMRDVYDVAAEHGVPVLLHTGFSPFPGSQTEPEFYDPLWLESLAASYDGDDGRPRVEFVLAHVGTGDLRAVGHALDVAERNDNIWLELSALSSAATLGADGEELTDGPPQYRYVLAEIADRGMVDRALFASDGPAFSGKILGYVGALVAEMQAQGYSTEQIRSVMSGNFDRLFGVD